MVLVLVDGVRVRSIRDSLGMDLEELSSRSGVSVKTLREMESSSHHRPSTVRKVARVLGVHEKSLALRKGSLVGSAA